MEKINIAELLRDCPQGMELYSPIFGKVYLDKVRRYLAIIVTTDRKQGDSKEEFLYDGRYGMNGECMLFPSKGKTTWEGFVPPCQFKDGDVIVVSGAIVLFKQVHSLYEEPHVDFYCGFISKHKTFILKTGEGQHCGKISSSRYATVEEKAELYEAIRDNGYRWNPKTKMLEKLPDPIFKIGQTLKLKGCPDENMCWRISDIKNYQYIFNTGRIIDIDEQHHYELIPDKWNDENKILDVLIEPKFKDGDILTTDAGNIFILKEPNENNFYYSCYIALIDFDSHIVQNRIQFCGKSFCRLATNDEKVRLFMAIKDNGYNWNAETKELEVLLKFKVGDKIQSKKCKEERTIKICGKSGYWTTIDSWININEQDNWELVSNKFDINTLKPFDKVLVRDGNDEAWVNAFFGFCDPVTYKKCIFVTGNENWCQCIPYEGNEHLLGKTDDCDEYFKNW